MNLSYFYPTKLNYVRTFTFCLILLTNQQLIKKATQYLSLSVTVLYCEMASKRSKMSILP